VKPDIERYEVHGVKVYQLNVCEAIHDHDLCPGITILHAGAFDIGTVACDCPCHKEPENEVPGNSPTTGVSFRNCSPMIKLDAWRMPNWDGKVH
jgi:hypothetical protein